MTFSTNAPQPPALTASVQAVTTTPTNQSTIQFRATFSQDIQDGSLVASDWNFPVSCGTSVAKESNSQYLLSLSNCSEGVATVSLKALSVLSASTGIAGPSSQTNTASVTVDRTAPTISFGVVTSPNNANPVSVTVTSTESLQGLDVSDFSAPGCSLSQSGSGASYALLLANCAEGPITLSMTGAATDAAGNTATNPTALTFVADRNFASGTASAPSTPTNNEPLHYRYSPGETLAAGAALASNEISVSGAGCSLNTGSISTDGSAFEFEVVGCSDGAQVQTAIMSGAFSDLAGNLSPLISFSNVTVDKAVGVNVIGGPQNTQRNSGAIDFTLSFTELVSGLTESDLAITGSSFGCALAPFAEQNNFDSFVVSVTGCQHGASVILTLKQNAVSDALGNLGPTTPVQTSAFVIDLVTPELQSITPRALIQNSSTVVYDLTFSEPVAGVVAAMFSSSSAGCSAPVVSSGGNQFESQWVVTLTGCADGAVDLDVNLTAAVTDAATNQLDSNAASATMNPQTVVVDTVAPTGSWRAAPAGPLNAQASYQIDFSEPISVPSFTGSDISNAGTAQGCVFVVSALDADSFEVSSTGCSDGTLQPRLLAGAVTDLAGNQLAASMTEAARTAGPVTLDFIAPNVSFTGQPANPNNGSTLSYQISFNEPVQSPAPSAFVMLGNVTGCSISIAAGTSDPDRVFDLEVSGCSEGIAVLTVNAYSVADFAGNLGPALATSASTLTVDRSPALATISTQTPSPTKDTTLVYAITFNEPIDSLVADSSHFNLTGSGCSLGTLTGAQPGTTFTLSVTGCDAAVSSTISLAAESVLDLAGNVSPATASASATIVTDRVPAQVIDFSVASGNSNGAVSYNLEFDEPVTGLTSADFSASGVVSVIPLAVTAISSTRYRVDVQALSSGTLTVSLASQSVVDAVGNLSPLAAAVSTAETISFDALAGAFTQSPTLTATGKISSSTLTWRVAVSRAIDLGDPAAVPVNADVALTAGTCSTVAISHLNSSTFEITATGCQEGLVQLELAAGAIVDPDGNVWPSGVLAAEAVMIDTLAPTVTAIAPVGAEQLARQVFLFEFNEPVSGVTLDDFSIAAAATATGCQLSYQQSGNRISVETSGCSDGTVGVTLARESATDLAGNLGPTSPVTTSLISKTTATPVVVPVAATTSEPVLLAIAPTKFVGPITQQAQAALLAAGIVEAPDGVGGTTVVADFTQLANPTQDAQIVRSVQLAPGEKLAVSLIIDPSMVATHEVVGFLKANSSWIDLGTSPISQGGVATLPAVFSEPGSYFIRLVVRPVQVQSMGFSVRSITSDPVMMIAGQALELDVAVSGAPITLIQPAATPPNYEGPTLINTPQTVSTFGGEVNFLGRHLASVSEVRAGGESLRIISQSDTSLKVSLEALGPGDYEVILLGEFGTVRVQNALRVTLAVAQYEGSGIFFTKRISPTEIKVYAKDIVGIGKIQFLVGGREIAWVRALDETDPKLRLADGSHYLVRTVNLEPGKNRLEIRVNGLRAKFATYIGD